LLAGVDGLIAEDTRLGFVTGYSDSSLNMGSGTHSSASVDSYHLGAYLGHQIDALRLTAGAAYSWHRVDVKRDLQFGASAANRKPSTMPPPLRCSPKRLTIWPATDEPGAVRQSVVRAPEHRQLHQGDAAALKGGEDNRDVVLSTLGVRAKRSLPCRTSISWNWARASAGSTT
jgi:subtilase-type serine protease